MVCYMSILDTIHITDVIETIKGEAQFATVEVLNMTNSKKKCRKASTKEISVATITPRFSRSYAHSKHNEKLIKVQVPNSLPNRLVTERGSLE